MEPQPIKAIPPPDPKSAIAPHQVWSHLSAVQQHQIRQTLIIFVQQFLPPFDRHSILEEPSDDYQ